MGSINEVAELVEKGKAKLVGAAVQDALDSGCDPTEILNKGMIDAMAIVGEKFKNGEVPLPDFWGGYRIVPNAFEFWQGRQNRLHDRFEYVKKSDSNSPAVWEISRLSP